MSFNKEAGDLVGIEIKIVPTPSGPKAAVQIAEGEPGPLQLLDVECDGKALRIQIPGGTRGIDGEFSGKISTKGIVGTLKYSNGASEELNIPRRKGYWDGP